MTRTIIIGGPMTGKSTLAIKMRCYGVPVYCGDPASKVRQIDSGVTYLPEGLPFSGDGGAADYISSHWFTLPGPWMCEGQVMARALRRAMADGAEPPCDRIIVLGEQYPGATPKQQSMHKGVMSVWAGIRPRCAHLIKGGT